MCRNAFSEVTYVTWQECCPCPRGLSPVQVRDCSVVGGQTSTPSIFFLFVRLFVSHPCVFTEPGEAHRGEGFLEVDARPERDAAQHHVQLREVYQAQRRDEMRRL